MTRTTTAFCALLAAAFCGCLVVLEAGTTAYETHCIQSGQRTVTECKLLARGR
jgi:hypothetical protein